MQHRDYQNLTSICMLNLCGILALLVLPLAAIAEESNEQFVVAPYLQWATQTEITILWETQQPTGGVLWYGPALPDSDKPNLSQSIELDQPTTMHEVRLQNLKPETVYFYRIVTRDHQGNEDLSPVGTFKTAVKADSPYAFAVFSDTQTNPRLWGQLAELGWRERPSFAIHAGDLVGTGANREHWVEHFLRPGNRFMSRFPLYSVLGNHEDDSDYYYQYMANPEPEYYYAFDYGNARFFFIDTNRDVGPGSVQYDWLEWELASSTATWNFVVHHHPPYSSVEDDYGDAYVELPAEGDEDVRQLIELYERYYVDVVFYGHIHAYERTWPIRNGRVDHDHGVVYLKVGGAGGRLEDFAPTRSWFTARLLHDHFMGMTYIAGEVLDFRLIEHDGRIFDHMRIDKRSRPKRAEIMATIPPARPWIEPRSASFTDSLEIKLNVAQPEQEIRYTLDGSEPTKASLLYTEPFSINDDSELKACAFGASGNGGAVAEASYRKLTPLPPLTTPADLKEGLRYQYFEGKWKMLPDFSALAPVHEGIIPAPRIEALNVREDYWGAVFEGYLRVHEPGVYTFELTSDDGSALEIHDVEVINNDGSHSTRNRSGRIALQPGYHPIRLRYFEDYMGQVLSLRWKEPGSASTGQIPAEVFFH
jgi:predicted phosphodiesterase